MQTLVFLCIENLRYFAGWADKGMCGKTIPVMDTKEIAVSTHKFHMPVWALCTTAICDQNLWKELTDRLTMSRQDYYVLS